MSKYYKRTPQGLKEISVIEAGDLRDGEKLILPDTPESEETKKETRKERTEREQKEHEGKILFNEKINPFGICPEIETGKDYGDTLAINNLD